VPILTPMGTVDARLLPGWQASWRRQRATRLVPASWLSDERPEAQQATAIWLDLLALRLPPDAGPRGIAALGDDDR
jgi:hypothetical protein